MAYNIKIPFYAFKLHFSNRNSIEIPLMDAAAIRINEPSHLLAGRYAELLQRKKLNKGSIIQILDEFVEGDYYRESLLVDFPAAKDKMSYPAFQLEFDYFYNQIDEKGYWAIVPTLGVETFSHSLEKLEENLISAIHLEFARKDRLKSVQSIISSFWFEKTELVQQEIDLRFPNLKELENIEDNSAEALLPKIAQKLSINQQITYGRKAELEQFGKALKGKFNRNVLLVGASGVGKTALVWEMARQKEKQRIEGHFWETTASVMIKELTGDTGWQDGLSIVCRELVKTGDILFVRNFMELFEVGQYEGNSVSMADYLRPFIGRGEVTLVSECTKEELAKIELRSPNYLSLFQLIRLETPRKDLAQIIVQKVKDLAANRKITIEAAAIEETLRLNQRFTPYAGLPGKPIRFLESILINQKALYKKENTVTLTRSEVIKFFCEETGMPLFMIDPAIPMAPTQIKADFNKQVFGQEKAVDGIVDLLAAVKTALSKTGKPIASLLFVGPTGVGKTELAKVLSQFMFGSRDKLVRFDMSEYADPYSVLRLTGIGYGQDGLLTAAVRREPFCVLLFDEIEKAHPNFFDLLLQVLSEGRLTDSSGKLVNFCSTIIIMTSNIGAANLQGNRISIKKEIKEDAVQAHFMSAVQQFFRPELYNRIDQIIPFAPLSKEVIHYVVEREVDLFKKLEGIQFRRLELQIEENVYEHLATIGYSPKYGARQLQRTIREKLIIPLSQKLNLHDNEDQLIATIKVLEQKIAIDIEADPLGLDLLLEELEKIDYADFASELRRNMAYLGEGRAFIKLLSDISQLTHKKNKNPKSFWGNQTLAEEYAYLLQTKENFVVLKESIEKLEESVSIAYMGLTAYDTNIANRLKDWQNDFLNYKIHLFSRTQPRYNTTYLTIYGMESQWLQEVYKQIAYAKNYKLAVKTIWYNEKLYKDYKTSKAEENVRELTKNSLKKIDAYISIDFDELDSKKFKAPNKGDFLCGVIFKLSGPAVHFYLNNETGLHIWKGESSKEDKRFYVVVSHEEMEPIEEVHRKDFYSKLAIKRQYYINLLEDKNQKWTSPLSVKRQYAKILLEQKDRIFEGTLDKELY